MNALCNLRLSYTRVRCSGSEEGGLFSLRAISISVDRVRHYQRQNRSLVVWFSALLAEALELTGRSIARVILETGNPTITVYDFMYNPNSLPLSPQEGLAVSH